jgi:hypothetical protein
MLRALVEDSLEIAVLGVFVVMIAMGARAVTGV